VARRDQQAFNTIERIVMSRIKSSAVTKVLIVASVWSGAIAETCGENSAPRSRVTRYDLVTPNELLLEHLVAPKLVGDVQAWSNKLLGGLPGQVGDWVTPYVDTIRIASTITQAFPIEGQTALQSVDALVGECARTLGLDKPVIYVRNHTQQRVYSVKAGGRYHLILTSSLLNLFEQRPEELKFVVGRELGHIKCGHSDSRIKAYAILTALQGINTAVVPDKYQSVFPMLSLGRLFTWSREAEISADRAGLLCCGKPEVAYEAIMRLQHGLAPNSRWIDATAKDFDAEKIVKDFVEWQYEPFVSFVLYLKRQEMDQPYYQERLAALTRWASSGVYRTILDRKHEPLDGQLIEIVRIQAFELAPEGEAVDAYVIVRDGEEQVLRTVVAQGVRKAQWHGFRSTDRGANQPRTFGDGQPLFFEIWDENRISDTFIGGFVIYPDAHDAHEEAGGKRIAEYTTKMRWDWNEVSSISRPGYARVRVEFTRRQTPRSSTTLKEPTR
jgi:Zn-dependent protease with chaperone function